MIFHYSFNIVINRTGLKAVLSEKFLEVFSWFEDELEEVQKVYENEKVTLFSLGLKAFNGSRK